jgi:hypothetical protein
MVRSRILPRGQAEVIAVYVLALLLVLMVGIAMRFYIMASQTLKQVEEKKREIQQTVLSGGVRGYISGNTVYLASGIPLLVYSTMIHNGSHILWINPKPPSGLTSYRTAMPIMEISSLYIPIYSGPLTILVEQCKARVVLATDKGLIKWCPNVVTKIVNNTVMSISGQLTALGSFNVYYVGNITYFGLYGNLTVSASSDASSSSSTDNSRTTLYPLIIFYNDPINVSEKWSGTVVNVTLRNTVTGDIAWIAFDVSSGSVVGKKVPANSSNTYDIVFYSPSKSTLNIGLAPSVKPINVGGIDVFVFTVYYAPPYYYAKELFTSTQLSISIGSYMNSYVVGNVVAPDAASAIQQCFATSVNPSTVHAALYSIYTSTPSALYVGVVSRATEASTFAAISPLAISMNAALKKNPYTQVYNTITVYNAELFTVSGSSPLQIAYYIAYSASCAGGACGYCNGCDQKPVTGVGTSWNKTKTCCNTYASTWYLVKAETRIALPSKATVPIGIYANMKIGVSSSPPPPAATTTITTTASGGGGNPPAWIYETYVEASLGKEYAIVYTTTSVDPTQWEIEWEIYDPTKSKPTNTTTYPLQRVCGLYACGLGGYVEIPKNGYVIAVVKYLDSDGKWKPYAMQTFRWR